MNSRPRSTSSSSVQLGRVVRRTVRDAPPQHEPPQRLLGTTGVGRIVTRVHLPDMGHERAGAAVRVGNRRRKSARRLRAVLQRDHRRRSGESEIIVAGVVGRDAIVIARRRPHQGRAGRPPADQPRSEEFAFDGMACGRAQGFGASLAKLPEQVYLLLQAPVDEIRAVSLPRELERAPASASTHHAGLGVCSPAGTGPARSTAVPARRTERSSDRRGRAVSHRRSRSRSRMPGL